MCWGKLSTKWQSYGLLYEVSFTKDRPYSQLITCDGIVSIAPIAPPIIPVTADSHVCQYRRYRRHVLYFVDSHNSFASNLLAWRTSKPCCKGETSGSGHMITSTSCTAASLCGRKVALAWSWAFPSFPLRHSSSGTAYWQVCVQW